MQVEVAVLEVYVLEQFAVTAQAYSITVGRWGGWIIQVVVAQQGSWRNSVFEQL